ncbi:hypothetical protein LPJ71_004422 [Coemansia sp. S17]|nr:hypothetical protein LPJ71_004422 [Coemansia sp. S17]
MKYSAVLSCIIALAGLTAGHVSIISPCPRYSPVGENCPALPAGESLDIAEKAINGPISSVQLGGTMPLCRHTTPYATPSATWTAGQSVTIKFNPSAAIHSGGNCEFSMSYDNGKTFAVIHRELRYCFLGSKPASLTNTATILSYTFNLPADLPSSDKAVFAWSWVNASGNREFYMNCADVAIKGGSSKSYTGPEMVVANYPGYPTIPEFNGNYETGMEHYTGAKNITVSPSGGSQPPASPNPPYATATAPVSSAPPVASPTLAYSTRPMPASYSVPAASPTPAYSTRPMPASYSAPVSSAPPVASPTYAAGNGNGNIPHEAKTGGSGSCSPGAMQCSGAGFNVCVGGAWSQTYSCGGGTACKSAGSGIYCGYP